MPAGRELRLAAMTDASSVKENVKPFTKAGLTEISALRPVTYSYNGLAGTPDDRTTGIAREGLIAQEVQKVAPQLISTVLRKLKPSDHAETALLEVDYGALTFGLINAVKELKVANDAQAGKTTVQAAEITRLRQQNTALAVQLKQQVADVQDVRTRLAALEHKVTFRTAENSIKPRH